MKIQSFKLKTQHIQTNICATKRYVTRSALKKEETKKQNFLMIFSK